MSWELIITGIFGIISGGTLTSLYLRKPTKGSATADALDKYSTWAESVLDNTVKQQEVFNNLITQKDEEIKELRDQIKDLKLRVAENERIVAGLQKTLTDEIGKRKYAENNICFVTECELRKPKLGTYKKEA